MPARLRWLGLPSILAVATVLRFWGLSHGLPFVMGRPDEAEALQHTGGFVHGDLNPHWFVYPNLFFWIIWLWGEAGLAIRRLVVDTPSYGIVLDHDLPLLILQGRVLSALVGTATVLVVHQVGRAAGGRALGLVAAALLAVCFLHVRDSHALKTDVHLALFVPLCVWALATYSERPTTSAALLAGGTIGLATAIKYPGVLLLVPAWHAAVAAAARTGWKRLVPHRTFPALVAATLVVFLAGCPYLVLDREHIPEIFTTSVKLVYGMAPEATSIPLAERVLAFLRSRSFAYHLTVSLRHGCGLGLALATPVAIAWSLRRGTPAVLRLSTTTLLAYYAGIGLSRVEMARYLTPVTPLLALLVGAVVVAASRVAGSARGRAAVACGLVAALAAEPLASSVAHDRIAARTDTRVEATRWMTEHLPAGSTATVLGSTIFHIADPELPPGVRAVSLGFGETDFDRYGITYVVTHEHVLPFSQVHPAQAAALKNRGELLAEFTPFTRGPTGGFERLDAFYIPLFDFAGVERPGPIVRIYRLTPPR